jgi:hypothetical protein
MRQRDPRVCSVSVSNTNDRTDCCLISSTARADYRRHAARLNVWDTRLSNAERSCGVWGSLGPYCVWKRSRTLHRREKEASNLRLGNLAWLVSTRILPKLKSRTEWLSPHADPITVLINGFPALGNAWGLAHFRTRWLAGLLARSTPVISQPWPWVALRGV